MKVKINTKRLFSSLLALMMVVNMVPPPLAFAAETDGTGSNMETLQPEEPNAPPAEPDTPTEPDASPTEPDTPLEESDTPSTEPDTPTEEPDTSPTESDEPAKKPNDKTSPVQALIDALPDADSITKENAADLQTQLTAIDEARLELSDEELDALDMTRYEAVISALMALEGMEGAEQPQTLADASTPVASVTIDGQTTYYNSFYGSTTDAWPATKGKTATIHLLKDVAVNGNVLTPEENTHITMTMEDGVTLALSGCTINPNKPNSSFTLESGTITSTGSVIFCQGDTAKVTINGGTLKSTGSSSQCISMENGTITITGGTFEAYDCLYLNGAVTAIINGGTFTSTNYTVRCDHSQAQLNITNGSFTGKYGLSTYGNTTVSGGKFTGTEKGLSVGGGTVTLSGGTFSGGQFSIDCQNISSTLANLLASGYVYQKSDGSSVNTGADTLSDGVSIVKEMVKITGQPQSVSYVYGDTTAHSLTVTATAAEADDTPLYQWYQADDANGSNPQAISGATGAEYTLPAGLNAGSHYYYCTVAPKEQPAFSLKSNVATVTVQKATLDISTTVYNGDKESTSFVYGDTITVRATTNPAVTAAAAANLTTHGAAQMALYYKDTQLSEPATADTSGMYTMTTTVKDVIAAGARYYDDSLMTIPLTVKLVGTDNINSASQNTKDLLLSKKTKIRIDVSKLEVTEKIYDGTNTATLIGTPSFTGFAYGEDETLTEGTDYTVSATYTDSNAGMNNHYVTVKVAFLNTEKVQELQKHYKLKELSGSISQQTIKPKPITPNVTLDTTSFVYNGLSQKPSVSSVTYTNENGETVEIESVQRTTTYEDSNGNPIAYNQIINAGTYTIIIKNYEGSGANYSFTCTREFTIAPADLKDAAVTISDDSYSYNGKAQTPEPVVTLGGRTLVKDTDYTVSHENNTNAGTAIAKIEGKGNYTGSVNKTFTISPAVLTIDGATLAAKTYDTTNTATVNSVTFTGYAEGDDALTTSEYSATATYDSADAGEGRTATVTVTLSNSNYTFADGKTTATHTLDGQTISAKPVANPTIELSDTSFVYNGEAQQPTVESVKDGTNVIPDGQYTATVNSGTDVGTYTVTITGKGNYSFSGTKDFTITQASIKDAAVTFDGIFSYTGDIQEPAPSVTFNGKILNKDTDYTVAYTGNTNAGEATVTVTGKGNYKDTATGNFTIAKVPLTIKSATLAPKTYNGDTTAEVQSVTFSGPSGDVALMMGDGKDYTATAQFADASAGENNKTATVTVKLLNGNYSFAEGATEATHELTGQTIKTQTLSDVTVTLTETSFVWDGNPKQPAFTVNAGNIVLTENDYSAAYSNNTAPGKGTVNVTGKGNYSFSATANFTITPASISGAEVSVADDYTYNGTAHQPGGDKVTVKLNGKTLMAGTDYDTTFGYGENINAGTDAGTVTITGKGNYKDTATGKFTIAKAQLTISGATLKEKTYNGDTTAEVQSVTFSGPSGDVALTMGNDGDYTATAEFTDNANAGKDKPATVTVTLDNTKVTNYILPVKTKSVTGTINPKVLDANNVSVTVKGKYEYNGGTAIIPDAKDVTVEYNEQNGEMMTGTEIDKSEYTFTCSDNTNAGTATITLNDAKDGNYTVSGSGTFTIIQPSLSDAEVTLTGGPFTYDGTEKTPNVTVTKNGRTLDTDEYTVTYSHSNGTSGDHTNAGTVTVTVTAIKDGNYADSNRNATFVIEQATLPEITLSAASATYNGKEQKPTITNAGLVENTDYEVSYKRGDEATTDFTSAGTITVSVTGKGNYEGTETKTYPIAQAVLTIKANDQTITYGGNITETINQVASTGLATGDTLTSVKLTASSDQVAEVNKTITPSDAVIKNGEKDVTSNYKITYQAGNLTINKAQPTIAFNGYPDTAIYSGTALANPTQGQLTITGAQFDDVKFSWTKDGKTTEPLGAGTYKLTATIPETNNTENAEATKEVTISAKPVTTPTVELSETSFVYDGSAKEPKVTVKDGNTEIPAGEYTVAYGNNINAGEAAVSITDKENGNYVVGNASKGFKITQASVSDAKVTTSESFSYDGTAHVPDSVTVKLGEKILETGKDYTVSATENIYAGSATVTVTGTGNYKDTASGKFNIAKAALTVKANDQTIIYGGNIEQATNQVTQTGLVDGDTIGSVKLIASSDQVAAENKTIIPSEATVKKGEQDVTSSYDITYQAGNLTINKSQPTIAFNSYPDTAIYSGKALANPTQGQLTITGAQFNDVKFSWTKDGKTAEPLGAGTYKLTATIPETGNTEKTVATKEVTINPKKVTATVTVSPESYKYTGSPITPTNVTVKDGTTTIPENEYTITCENNTEVGDATVTVKAKDGGNYTFSDVNANFKIVAEPDTVSLDKNLLSLTVGDSGTLKATVKPDNATDKSVIWKSNNPEVATVDTNGKVTAKETGTATIAAITHNGKSASCAVTVKARTYTVSYNKNGGEGTMNSDTATDGKSFVLPGCGFTPPEKNMFDTWAVGSVSGERVKAGESHKFTGDTTLYAIWKETPPVIYTVSYNANGGSGRMTDATAPDKEAFVLPECRFTPPAGKMFDCWAVGGLSGPHIKPGGSYTFKENTTIYAVWEITYGITGIVKQKDEAVSGAAVQLKQGSTLISQQYTDNKGNFTFAGFKKGIYNLVAEKDGVTMTKMETINENRTLTIELPALEIKANSVVEIVESNSEGEKILTPDVVVGGLDAVAVEIAQQAIAENGGSSDGNVEKVTVTMSVEEKPETEAVGVDKIKDEVAKQQPTTAKDTKLAYLDVQINALITKATESENPNKPQALTETKTVMELVVPFDFKGKKDVKVYRYHVAESGQEETEALNKATDDTSVDGTYKVDEANGLIHIYTRKFSTYAIGYTDSNPDNTNDPDNTYQPSGSSGSGGGGGISSYSIGTTAKPENGTVAFDKNNASKGSTVTITVTPKEGYVLDTLTVTDAKNNKMNLTDKGGGKYTFIMPDSKVNVDAQFIKADDKPDIPATEDPTKGFSDLTDNSWYHEAVEYVLSEGIMGGYGNGKFGPDENLSRAQLAQILYNREGRPESAGTSVFTDVVSGKWYTNAIIWANQKGVVGGYGNGLFGPDDPITREQLAVMLWRYAGNPPAANKELHFDDAGEAGSFALEALQWSVENGIITGYGDRRINPKGLATRAQAAQMLMRYLKGMEEK